MITDERVVGYYDPMTGYTFTWNSLRVAEWEKILIRAALFATKGNRTKAAKLLGINVRTLRRKVNGKS